VGCLKNVIPTTKFDVKLDGIYDRNDTKFVSMTNTINTAFTICSNKNGTFCYDAGGTLNVYFDGVLSSSIETGVSSIAIDDSDIVYYVKDGHVHMYNARIAETFTTSLTASSILSSKHATVSNGNYLEWNKSSFSSKFTGTCEYWVEYDRGLERSTIVNYVWESMLSAQLSGDDIADSVLCDLLAKWKNVDIAVSVAADETKSIELDIDAQGGQNSTQIIRTEGAKAGVISGVVADPNPQDGHVVGDVDRGSNVGTMLRQDVPAHLSVSTVITTSSSEPAVSHQNIIAKWDADVLQNIKFKSTVDVRDILNLTTLASSWASQMTVMVVKSTSVTHTDAQLCFKSTEFVPPTLPEKTSSKNFSINPYIDAITTFKTALSSSTQRSHLTTEARTSSSSSSCSSSCSSSSSSSCSSSSSSCSSCSSWFVGFMRLN
jgi:hypothetical protein